MWKPGKGPAFVKDKLKSVGVVEFLRVAWTLTVVSRLAQIGGLRVETALINF